MVLILLGLCAILSADTLSEQVSTGAAGGEAAAREALQQLRPGANVVVIGGEGHEDSSFAEEATHLLKTNSANVVARVQGSPRDARLTLEKLAKDGIKIDAIVASARAGRWALLDDSHRNSLGLSAVPVVTPHPYV